jgi:DNA-binding transcriptional ArsR family regulator
MVQRARLSSKLSVKVREEADKLEDIERILSVLSNEDALKIFKMAGDGIACSTEAIRKMGLTQKRYYTRLNELLEAKLIRKDDGAYKHTILGSIIYRVINYLSDIVEREEQLELMDKVKRARNLSDEEKERIIQSIAKERIRDFLNLIDGGVKLVGLVYRFEDIVKGTIELLEKAEREVYLATRYTDNDVVEAVFKAFGRGVGEWHIISSDRNVKNILSQRIQLIRMMIAHPEYLKAFFTLLNSSKVQTGYVEELPYSFIVVDRKYVGIEVLNPDSKGFLLGLFFENEILAEKLIEIFNSLMAKAREDPLRDAITGSLTIHDGEKA